MPFYELFRLGDGGEVVALVALQDLPGVGRQAGYPGIGKVQRGALRTRPDRILQLLEFRYHGRYFYL